MSGFPSCDEARAYASVVERYLSILRDHDVPVVATELVQLEPAPGRHVVYLVQPRLDPDGLGNTRLRQLALEDLFPLLERVLGIVRGVLDANPGRRDGREVAIDAQLSLRLRHLQRFLTTRLLRRRSDFLLPGRIVRHG